MLASVLIASAFAAFASAQSASSTQTQAMPPSATQGFNPGNVSASDSAQWCLAQRNTCPEICGSKPGNFASTNLCDSTAFTYTCICNNGTEPDCTRYQQTLPYYICLATFSQCTNTNAGNLPGLNNCKTNEQCGSLNASALEPAVGGGSSSASSSASSTMTMMSSMASAAPSQTSGSGSSSAASVASSSAASASATGNVAASSMPQLATGTFAAILFAVFKLVL